MNESFNGFAGIKHYAFIEVFQALNYQVNVTILGYEETLGDFVFNPNGVEVCQSLLKHFIIEGVALQNSHSV